MSFARYAICGLISALMIEGVASTTNALEPWIADPPPDALAVARPANYFGSKVLDNLVGAPAAANVVFSPYGLSSALDILTLGAAGTTQKLLLERRGQRPGDPSSRSVVNLRKLLMSAATADVTLRIADSVWLKAGADPNNAFDMAAHAGFDARVESIDFTKPDAADTINKWVNTATQELIPRVVDRLEPQTEFVLINAIYFKGKWALPFEKDETKPAPFTRTDGSKHQVPMMHQVAKLPYAEADNWHAVSVPYQGDRFRMIVMTAKDPANSAAVRGELGAKGFIRALDGLALSKRDVTLSLPRFRAESGSDLTGVLSSSEIGLGPVFGAEADFRHLTSVKIRATSVIQRAMVELAEEGTEAAAATGVLATRSADQTPQAIFAADRPFAFAIVDSMTGTVLFMGYVADPA
jgi:serpin B